jgi:hypothetical protein
MTITNQVYLTASQAVEPKDVSKKQAKSALTAEKV